MNKPTQQTPLQARVDKLHARTQLHRTARGTESLAWARSLSNQRIRREIKLSPFRLQKVVAHNTFADTRCHKYFEALVRSLVDQGGGTLLDNESVLTALGLMASKYHLRVRPIKSWIALPGKPYVGWMHHMIGHLFAAYPVPRFMTSFWLKGEDEFVHTWYLHVARGGSLRALPGAPIAITRKMAHFLSMDGESTTKLAALRTAQLRALGADAAFLKAAKATHLYTEVSQPAFWAPVLQWLVRHFDAAGTLSLHDVMDYFQRKWSPEAQQPQLYHWT